LQVIAQSSGGDVRGHAHGATNLTSAGYRHLRRDPDFLNRDPDLASLRNNQEWEGLIEQLTSESRDYLNMVNPQLYELFKQDQLDRIFIDWSKPEQWRAIGPRDRQRSAELAQILQARELSTAEDYFHAGQMLMHGRDSTEYFRAGTLAREAMRLDSGSRGDVSPVRSASSEKPRPPAKTVG
jgi:hypothetical protein